MGKRFYILVLAISFTFINACSFIEKPLTATEQDYVNALTIITIELSLSQTEFLSILEEVRRDPELYIPYQAKIVEHMYLLFICTTTFNKLPSPKSDRLEEIYLMYAKSMDEFNEITNKLVFGNGGGDLADQINEHYKVGFKYLEKATDKIKMLPQIDLAHNERILSEKVENIIAQAKSLENNSKKQIVNNIPNENTTSNMEQKSDTNIHQKNENTSNISQQEEAQESTQDSQNNTERSGVSQNQNYDERYLISIDKDYLRYENKKFGYSLIVPTRWEKWGELMGEDGIILNGDIEISFESQARKYREDMDPFQFARDNDLLIQKVILNSGYEADLITGNFYGTIVFEMIVIENDIEYHIKATPSETFYNQNQQVLLDIVKSFKIKGRDY